jgi:hypothetical protein
MGGWESIPNIGIDLGIPFHPRDTEISLFCSLTSVTTGGLLSDKDALRESQKKQLGTTVTQLARTVLLREPGRHTWCGTLNL